MSKPKKLLLLLLGLVVVATLPLEAMATKKITVVTTPDASKNSTSSGIGSTQPPVAAKKINIVTTLNVIKSITQEIGGDLVHVDSLLSAGQDPHSLQDKPSLKNSVGKAQLFLQIGRSLELWAPQVIKSSASTAKQVDVETGFKSLDIPPVLTRAKGDIHPQGNPHIWLSPIGGLKMAENIKNALISIDPSNKSRYEANFTSFKTRLSDAIFGKDLVKAAGTPDFLWRQLDAHTLKNYLTAKKKTVGGILQRAAALNFGFISFHSVFAYFIDDLGLQPLFADAEEKPGSSSSKEYIDGIVKRALANGVKHVIAATYYTGERGLLAGIATRINGSLVFINVDSEGNETYVQMLERIIRSFESTKKGSA